MASLQASLRRVIASRRVHSMGIQRYDIPWANEASWRSCGIWSAGTVGVSPIIDATGKFPGIVHSVEDVTGFHEDLVAALEYYRTEVRFHQGDDEDRDRRFAEYAPLTMSATVATPAWWPRWSRFARR